MKGDKAVVPIRPVVPEKDEEMIAMLRDLLERAEKGELLGFALAAHVRGDTTMVSGSISGQGDVAHLVCAIERLKLRLLED